MTETRFALPPVRTPLVRRVFSSLTEGDYVALSQLARNGHVKLGEVIRAFIRQGLAEAGKLGAITASPPSSAPPVVEHASLTEEELDAEIARLEAKLAARRQAFAEREQADQERGEPEQEAPDQADGDPS